MVARFKLWNLLSTLLLGARSSSPKALNLFGNIFLLAGVPHLCLEKKKKDLKTIDLIHKHQSIIWVHMYVCIILLELCMLMLTGDIIDSGMFNVDFNMNIATCQLQP